MSIEVAGGQLGLDFTAAAETDEKPRRKKAVGKKKTAKVKPPRKKAARKTAAAKTLATPKKKGSQEQQTAAPAPAKQLFAIRALKVTRKGHTLEDVAAVFVDATGLRVERASRDGPWNGLGDFASALEKGLSLPDRAGHLLPIDGRAATLPCQRLALDDELQRLSNGWVVCEEPPIGPAATPGGRNLAPGVT